MTIREETPEDATAIAEVVVAALGRHEEARLIDRLREHDAVPGVSRGSARRPTRRARPLQPRSPALTAWCGARSHGRAARVPGTRHRIDARRRRHPATAEQWVSV